MLGQQELDRLREDLTKATNEIHRLWLHHDFFWRVMEVINHNERLLASGGHLINWLKNSYIETGCVEFRRQLDFDKRSLSLVNVLTQLKREAGNITKSLFLGFVTFEPGSPFHNPDACKAAENDFDRLFGTGKPYLDAAIVQLDIDLLVTEGKSIKEFVNKEIAHLNRTGMRDPKPTGHLFEKSVNHLEQTAAKYFYLLTGQKLTSLRPQFADGFPEELFTFPWIEKTLP